MGGWDRGDHRWRFGYALARRWHTPSTRRAEVLVRLLLIEPDAQERSELERTMTGRGHDASVASTGFDALRMVLDHEFDAVVLDLELPDVGGFEVLRMLRAVSDVAVVAT